MNLLALLASATVLIAGELGQKADPPPQEVVSAMAKATRFMFDRFANRGGFVWWYTTEGDPYGELKARPSMIWVEPPGTPTVGIMLVEAYKATADPTYLARAEEAASALVYGQHPSGGWHYFIDFDPDGVQQYYDDFFSKCWGWQEYLKFRHNCTFDDYTTTEATRFLLRLYDKTRDPRWRTPLEKALHHILDAQYSNGAWPQRFPFQEGSGDYTAYYTFNDDVIRDCIDVLWEAGGTIGDQRYYNAARRGMDFYLLSQLPKPQAGWAQQYDLNLMPAQGRPFELPSVCAGQTYSNLRDLMGFYRMTGDARYLAPVPDALAWLRAGAISQSDGFTHTMFYEIGSNRPIYVRQTGTTIEDVKFTKTYDENGAYPYGPRISLSLDSLEKEYDALRETGISQPGTSQPALLPDSTRGHYLARVLAEIPQTADGIREVLTSQEDDGGWRESIAILDAYSPFSEPPVTHEGYTTGGYVARMYRLINYLNGLEKP